MLRGLKRLRRDRLLAGRRFLRLGGWRSRLIDGRLAGQRPGPEPDRNGHHERRALRQAGHYEVPSNAGSPSASVWTSSCWKY